MIRPFSGLNKVGIFVATLPNRIFRWWPMMVPPPRKKIRALPEYPMEILGKFMGRPWIDRIQPAVGERFGMVCAFPG